MQHFCHYHIELHDISEMRKNKITLLALANTEFHNMYIGTILACVGINLHR